MALLSSRMRPIIASVAIGGVGTGLLYTYFVRNVDADSSVPQKVFGKGPAFVSLPLESSEVVNHNTKRLRFRLPNPDDISGLTLTCKWL